MTPAVLPSALVSIITAVHRAQSTLPAAIASVLAQSYPHWELLLVMDDSEPYPGLARLDPRIQVLRTGGHGRGPAYARNLALVQARGDYITWLDADDVIDASRLATLLPLAAETGAACDNYRMVEQGRPQVVKRLFNGTPPDMIDARAFCDIDRPVISLLHRNLVPCWEADIGFAEDFLLNLRAMDRCGCFAVHPSASYEYRIHPHSLCNDEGAADRAATSYTRILDHLARGNWGFSPEIAQLVRDTVQRKHALNERFRQARAAGLVRHFDDLLSLPLQNAIST